MWRIRKGGKSPISLADRARDRRDWALARRYYHEALRRNPDDPTIWVQYGHALKESGNVFEAEDAYRKSLTLDPRVADTHLQLGHALKIQGKKNDAAASYFRALALDPSSHDASSELLALGWTLAGLNEWMMARITRALQWEDSRFNNEIDNDSSWLAPPIVFDVSDLIDYFSENRLPTGIQRVQINVIRSLLRNKERNFEILIACMTRRTDLWVRVPEALFLELAELAVVGGRNDDPLWRGILLELDLWIAASKSLIFSRDSVLVNMGTSWWLPDYFLKIKQIKFEYGVRYIPFVHDCIPVLLPEYCVKGLVQDFIRWLNGVFFLADGYLVNSKATAADLTKVAAFLGHFIPEPHVIRLDGQFSVRRERSDGGDLITRRRLEGEPFVLFVGTIEARKNHLLAFNVWQTMIRKRGLKNTPILVCVGKPGWLMEPAMARLNASELLQRRVLILSTVADDELAELYQHCLFTVFPSSYEGWGLPVTEALSYGKIPLTTAISALPEAGGKLAEYFDHLSERDMLEKLERLIDDEAYRTARETEIRSSFKPRSWEEIADEIAQCVLPRGDAVTSLVIHDKRQFGAALAPPAEIGRYYAFSRNFETTLRPGMVLGEMFRFGSAWHYPEDWGVWLKPGIATIAFTLSTPHNGRHRIYLGLRGNPLEQAGYRLQIAGSSGEQSGTVRRHETQWVVVDIGSEPGQRGTIRIEFETQRGANLRDVNEGDARVVSVGMIGFYICPEDDLPARQLFVEAVQLNRLEGLSGKNCEGFPQFGERVDGRVSGENDDHLRRR